MIVSFRYIMKDDAGAILENTMNSDPVSYLHGSFAILQLLQLQLEGLKRGDKKIIYLNAESGTHRDFIFEIIVDDVRNALDEELILGYPVKTDVAKCEEDCDCYVSTNNIV